MRTNLRLQAEIVATTTLVLLLPWGARGQCPPSPPADLILPNAACTSAVYASGTYSFAAANSIVTSGNLTISGGAAVTFKAGSVLRLEPGFHATGGTGGVVFHALIGPVQAGPDFSISGPPSSPSIAQAGTGSALLSLVANNALSGGVVFSSSGFQSGITFQYPSTTLSADGSVSANVTILVASTVAPGAYSGSIGATVGAVTRASAFSINVTPASQLAGPTFSPVSGVYVTAQNIGISGPSGSTLQYSVNGGAWTTYNQPVPIASNALLSAVARKGGWLDSAVSTAAYQIGSGGASGTPVREYLRLGSQVVAVESSGAQVSVAVGPPSAVVGTGDTLQYYALVSGTPNQGVTWSAFQGGIQGNITASGLFTAPYSVSNGPVTITARSVADTSKSGSVTASLVKTQVSMNPGYTVITPGQTVQLYATVSNNSNPAVTWSLSSYWPGSLTVDPNNGNHATYQGPANGSSTQYAVVDAFSVNDGTAASSATIQINPVPVLDIASVSPINGSASSANFTIQAAGGASPVYEMLFYLNSSISASGGCLVYYRSTDGAFAVGDSSYSWTGSPYCNVTGHSYSAGANNSGSLSVSVSFTSAWAGSSQGVWAYATNTGGSAMSNWKPMGLWTIP